MTNWTSVEQRWQRMVNHVTSIWRGKDSTTRQGNDLEEIALAEENQAIAVSQTTTEASEQQVRLQL